MSPPAGWSERGAGLPRLALRRPVTVAMASMALIVIGVVAYARIPRELLPSGFTPPLLFVQIPTRISTPKDNERSVAIPIEESFGTVRNVDSMRAWVNQDRVGFLLQFKDGTDMDVAYTQVRDRLDRVMPDLPTDLGKYFIWKYNPSAEPIFWIGAVLPEGLKDGDAAWLLESRLVKRLERVPGVSRVQLEGAPDREIHIEVDDKRANAAGVGAFALVERLQSDNFAVAAGTLDDGGERYPLRVVARFEDLDQVRAIPIGNGLRLRDVAEVRYVTPDTDAIYRINGRPGVIVQVFKEGEANTVDVCAAVEALVHSGDPELSRFEFIEFFNQGFHIEESLYNLQITMLWGGLFAIVILFFFLRRVGITLVITLAIPASMMVTLVVMYFTGATLNALSMMGLMLSVGMVVDNSIVVVENIQRARIEGLDAIQAAIYGTGEVALAILVATSTTVVVFLPLILMSGSETLSFYLGKIGYPVCIALAASLAVSLIFIPLASTWRVSGADRIPPPLPMITWLEDRFAALLDLSLRRRADALLLTMLAFLSIFIPAGQLKETDTKAGNPNDFQIFTNFEDDASYAEKDAYLKSAEAALMANAEALGISDVLTRMGGNWGRARLRVFLKDLDERDGLDREEIVEKAQAILPVAPGVSTSTSWSERAEGASDTIRLGLKGPDSDKLAELAAEVAWRVRNVPGVVSVELETDDDATRELHMRVQRELAAQRGLSPLIIGGTVGYTLQGRRLNDFHAEDREVSMIVIAPRKDREGLQDLQNVALRDPSGGPGVALGNLTTSSLSPAYRSITREDRHTLYEIVVTASDDDLLALGQSIDAAMAGFEFPRGYALSKGERFSNLETNQDEQSFALIMAVLCVFLLMGILFESFLLPLSIVVSIPFAFVGVYWALFLTDTAFDVMAGIGLIILVGVVVNNAVVLIDLVEILRRQGLDRHLALVEAGRKRLRPILMTALTTIIGLLPMAMGTASIVGIPYAPLGRALIGGMTASTLLTLLVVPLCYTAFDDLREVGLRLAARMASRAPSPRSPP